VAIRTSNTGSFIRSSDVCLRSSALRRRPSLSRAPATSRFSQAVRISALMAKVPKVLASFIQTMNISMQEFLTPSGTITLITMGGRCMEMAMSTKQATKCCPIQES
jgi:hypothetical protein